MARRDEILQTAAELFAQRGFHGVSIADLGAACGISGPAIYKHFAGKDAILAELLVAISDELLAEGTRRVRDADDNNSALTSLVDWHASFAIAHPELIVLQDRDWSSLPPQAREQVRETQRKYVAVWVRVLRKLRPDLDQDAARSVVHANFGLLNSTPHSGLVDDEQMHRVLVRMGTAALLA